MSGIFNQTYDEAETDEIYRLAYVAATRGIRRVIWFVDDSQSTGASFRLRHHHPNTVLNYLPPLTKC